MTTSCVKAGVVLALSLTALTACSDDGPAPSEAATPIAVPSSTAATAAPDQSVVATPSPTQAQPSADKVVLFGNDLGPAKIGDPFDSAVAALSRVLGQPDPEGDAATCLRGDRQVTWGDFEVTADDGKLAGWVSSDPDLATPSGIRPGSTVATLKRVYGSKLALTKASGAESQPEFSVQGSVVQGIVSGFSAGDRVEVLFTSACGQP